MQCRFSSSLQPPSQNAHPRQKDWRDPSAFPALATGRINAANQRKFIDPTSRFETEPATPIRTPDSVQNGERATCPILMIEVEIALQGAPKAA